MRLGANGNIVFLIAYTITFSKMYSFHTLHKIPAKIHSEPDYYMSLFFVYIFTKNNRESLIFITV